MKTWLKIVILIVTLGLGFIIGWSCREAIFKGKLTEAVGGEFMAEKLGGDSLWKPGMKPVDFVERVAWKLLEI